MAGRSCNPPLRLTRHLPYIANDCCMTSKHVDAASAAMLCGQTTPLTTWSRLRPVARSHNVRFAVCAASKGFGAGKKPSKVDEKAALKGSKGRRVRQPAPPVPSRDQAALSLSVPEENPLEAAKSVADEAEFMQRLKALKAEGKEKKAAAASPQGTTTIQGAVFDAAPPEDIYANPPTIMDTLQDKLQSDISDPALRRAKIGPGVAGLALGSIALGLIIVLVSGGDIAPSTDRYKGIRPRQVTEQEYAQLSARASDFEDQLASNPRDLGALEALAVTYAKMQDYPKASGLLDQLVVARPDYSDAWRLLGEASLLSGEAGRSVTAYEKALDLVPTSQTVLTGLTDAYIANGQQGKAVTLLTKLRDQGPSSSAASSSSSSSSSSTSGAESEADSSSAASEGASTSGSSSSTQLDPVAVQLLLGKAYAGWRGHDSDALGAYDALVASAPQDFRGYLAKGIFLKERGRRGDAERMFLQAKFYAPDNMQAFVKARAGEEAVVDLPDNS